MPCCFSRPINVSHMDLEALRTREAQLDKDLYLTRVEDWNNSFLIGVAGLLITWLGILLILSQNYPPGEPTNLAFAGLAIACLGAFGTVLSHKFVCKSNGIAKELQAVKAAISRLQIQRG